MTTSCVHLDLLDSIDTDAFLMALRWFIARRGKPFEILSDRGTNFRGGAAELQASVAALEAPIREQLAGQEIEFRFNPPSSPHFGGTWEREIKSVKTALQVVLGNQTVTETVLQTVLRESSMQSPWVTSLAMLQTLTQSRQTYCLWDVVMHLSPKQSMHLVICSEDGDDIIARFLQTTSGPTSVVTICLTCRSDRNGRGRLTT